MTTTHIALEVVALLLIGVALWKLAWNQSMFNAQHVACLKSHAECREENAAFLNELVHAKRRITDLEERVPPKPGSWRPGMPETKPT